MDKKKQDAGEPANDTSERAGPDAACGQGIRQAMAEMIENCGGCDEMMGMFGGKRRARRTPDSPTPKV